MKNVNEDYRSIHSDSILRFNKGDIVKVNKLSICPIMIVKDIVFEYTDSGYIDNGRLVGINCWWFDTTLQYNEEIFNTKDLVLVNNNTNE